MRQELSCHSLQTQIRRAFPGNSDKLLTRQTETCSAKKLPQKALDAISGYSIADFARSSYAQALRGPRQLKRIKQKMRADKLSAAGIDSLKFTAPSDAPVAWKARVAASQAVGARRLRPFSRRLRIMARPPGVDMRARKPCLRARRILLG